MNCWIDTEFLQETTFLGMHCVTRLAPSTTMSQCTMTIVDSIIRYNPKLCSAVLRMENYGIADDWNVWQQILTRVSELVPAQLPTWNELCWLMHFSFCQWDCPETAVSGPAKNTPSCGGLIACWSFNTIGRTSKTILKSLCINSELICNPTCLVIVYSFQITWFFIQSCLSKQD